MVKVIKRKYIINSKLNCGSWSLLHNLTWVQAKKVTTPSARVWTEISQHNRKQKIITNPITSVPCCGLIMDDYNIAPKKQSHGKTFLKIFQPFNDYFPTSTILTLNYKYDSNSTNHIRNNLTKISNVKESCIKQTHVVQSPCHNASLFCQPPFYQLQ